MIIGNNTVQKDVLAKLQAEATITSLLTSADDIKEDQYGGTDFNFPAVRLAMLRQTPLGGEPCDHWRMSFAARCYAEGASSLEADKIMTAIVAFLDGREIRTTEWYGWAACTSVSSAIQTAERLWRSEAAFDINVYATS